MQNRDVFFWVFAATRAFVKMLWCGVYTGWTCPSTTPACLLCVLYNKNYEKDYALLPNIYHRLVRGTFRKANVWPGNAAKNGLQYRPRISCKFPAQFNSDKI